MISFITSRARMPRSAFWKLARCAPGCRSRHRLQIPRGLAPDRTAAQRSNDLYLAHPHHRDGRSRLGAGQIPHSGQQHRPAITACACSSQPASTPQSRMPKPNSMWLPGRFQPQRYDELDHPGERQAGHHWRARTRAGHHLPAARFCGSERRQRAAWRCSTRDCRNTRSCPIKTRSR